MELHIVLIEPEIPQNTGSIGRSCVALGATLHLIKPLGFSLSDKYMKRAGLDYWHKLNLEIHDTWGAFLENYPEAPLWYLSTKALRRHDEVQYGKRAFLVFGKESAGIPDTILERAPERCIRLPIREEARSLNLSVAVGVAAYEVMRQNDFLTLSCSDPERRLFGG